MNDVWAKNANGVTLFILLNIGGNIKKNCGDACVQYSIYYGYS